MDKRELLEMGAMSKSPRVESVIAKVMAEHPGTSARAQADYYEAVHQELAPLAREMERDLTAIKDERDAMDELIAEYQRSERKLEVRVAELERQLAEALKVSANSIDLINEQERQLAEREQEAKNAARIATLTEARDAARRAINLNTCEVFDKGVHRAVAMIDDLIEALSSTDKETKGKL